MDSFPPALWQFQAHQSTLRSAWGSCQSNDTSHYCPLPGGGGGGFTCHRQQRLEFQLENEHLSEGDLPWRWGNWQDWLQRWHYQPQLQQRQFKTETYAIEANHNYWIKTCGTQKQGLSYYKHSHRKVNRRSHGTLHINFIRTILFLRQKLTQACSTETHDECHELEATLHQVKDT